MFCFLHPHLWSKKNISEDVQSFNLQFFQLCLCIVHLPPLSKNKKHFLNQSLGYKCFTLYQAEQETGQLSNQKYSVNICSNSKVSFKRNVFVNLLQSLQRYIQTLELQQCVCSNSGRLLQTQTLKQNLEFCILLSMQSSSDIVSAT